MNENKKRKTVGQLVDEVKLCGESITENAETIVGTGLFESGIDITAYIHMDEAPYVRFGADIPLKHTVKPPNNIR